MEIKNQKNLKVELLNMAPYFTNSVMVSYGGKCVIFDAWGHANDWIKLLRDCDLELDAIYSTHGHPDHIVAAPGLAKSTGAKWFLDDKDFNLIGWGNDLLANFGLPPMTCDIPPTKMPKSAQILNGSKMDIIPCPGHTRGGVAFYIRDINTFIVGDTLFADSIGRTDLPGGDLYALKDSIAKIYQLNLPDDTTVIPGHGEITTIAKMKTENPFFRFHTKTR